MYTKTFYGDQGIVRAQVALSTGLACKYSYHSVSKGDWFQDTKGDWFHGYQNPQMLKSLI